MVSTGHSNETGCKTINRDMLLEMTCSDDGNEMTTMNDLPTAALYTPDDLLRLPDGDAYELVDGRLVEKHMGGESSLSWRPNLPSAWVGSSTKGTGGDG